MGILSKLFFVFLPFVGASTVVVLRMGNQLPHITRQTGQSFGMFHNYLKVLIRHLTPRSTPGVEMVRKFRQTGQQAFAFSNEVKWNLLENHTQLKSAFPDITSHPLYKGDPPAPKFISPVTSALAQAFEIKNPPKS